MNYAFISCYSIRKHTVLIFFFIYNYIDTRSCTRKVQPLQSAGDPCIAKIRRDLRIGQESKVSVDAGLERLKVIRCWEDGRRKRVPVSRCHRDYWFFKMASGFKTQPSYIYIYVCMYFFKLRKGTQHLKILTDS